MEHIRPYAEFLIFSTLAGILATALMTYTMHLITRTGLANADIVLAVGSFFTGTRDPVAFNIGIVLHTLTGIALGLVYSLLFGLSGAASLGSYLFVGGIAGFMQGFVLSFLLIITLAEHHPLQEFRESGPGAAVAHILGVTLFGLIAAVAMWYSGFRFM